MSKKKILIVDDTELNRILLSEILSPQYSIVEAQNGLEAVEILKKYHESISIILLDITMPVMDGFEVLAEMHKNDWISDIPVIMISSEDSSTYIDHAYDLGATEYIVRPFDEKTVLHRINNTIAMYTKQKMLKHIVTEQIMERERSNSQMVEILSNIVEFRNGESGLHVLHIRVITSILLHSLRRLAPQYNLTPSSIVMISNASTMHDIGKISIDEKILNKPGRLTPEEYEIMKTHAVIGAQILEKSSITKDSELLKTACEICRWHHERYDGRGYPDGLKGEEIPIAAQVVALADVYDALTSERVYKPAYPHEKAIDMIMNGECGQFNPLLLQCLEFNSKKLQAEVSIHSPRNASSMEIQQIAKEHLMRTDANVDPTGMQSIHRAKFHFYSAESRQLLFEYNCTDEILDLAPRTSKCLGLPETVFEPLMDKHVAQLGKTELLRVRNELNKIAPKHGKAHFSTTVTLNLEKHKNFNLQMCLVWEDPAKLHFTGVVGKLKPLD